MLHAQALEHLRAGRPQAALELLQAQLCEDPSNAAGWFLAGACHHALKSLQSAAQAFARSLALDDSRADVHLALITVLRESGNRTAALDAALKAGSRFPAHGQVAYATAVCLEDLDRNEEALAGYDRALSLDPRLEDALHNRCMLLARNARLEEAERDYQRYAELYPSSPRALSGLADTLIALGRYDGALATLERLASLTPQDVGVQMRRAVALSSLRRFAEAEAAFGQAGQESSDGVAAYLQRVVPNGDRAAMLSPRNIFFGHAWKALGECDWSIWDAFAVEMRAAAAEPNAVLEPAAGFMSRLLPLSGAERHAVCRRIAATVEASNPVLPPAPPRQRPRLRIGVLSPDFREHLNAHLLLPFFELLDRSRLECFAYSLSPDDGSAIRARIRSAVDAFRDLQNLGDRDAAMAIRQDDIDVLVDVGGHTTGARFAITAQRPAPLQVNYLGFSCSLASSRVDYAIVDHITGGDPAEWSEALVFLPHTHFLYDFRNAGSHAEVVRQDYGLPEGAFVYCAFHRAEKITPDAFALWMQILAAVPKSVLWFRGLSKVASRNLQTQAASHGIARDRLVFAPFEASAGPRYFARHRLGDLMLDSLHHNAMTSACDALSMGLPLLTLPGKAMASRASASMLRAADLPELIAANEADYVRIAVQLGSNPAATRALRRKLAEARQSAPLFDTAGRVRALESALHKMHERRIAGEPPASFDA